MNGSDIWGQLDPANCPWGLFLRGTRNKLELSRRGSDIQGRVLVERETSVKGLLLSTLPHQFLNELLDHHITSYRNYSHIFFPFGHFSVMAR